MMKDWKESNHARTMTRADDTQLLAPAALTKASFDNEKKKKQTNNTTFLSDTTNNNLFTQLFYDSIEYPRS